MMKKILPLLLFIFSVSAQAQDFKPYDVESGKIVYEKLEYKTEVGFSFVDGVETGYRRVVPYVSEQVTYYWDEFGDIAFEETYQVSSFGGDSLPEKVKVSENLWIGDHRYYYDAEEDRISDEPYYLRIECRENFQYYQIIGSWIETQYMGVEASETKEILGKEADYYKIDGSTDLFAWKGLVLKEEDFYTKSSGNERYDPVRTKIAVEIDTVSEVDEGLFNPLWYQRELSYQAFDRNSIDEQIESYPDLFEQAHNKKGIEIKENDILLYVSTPEHHLGKMQLLSIDGSTLRIKFAWYYNDNSLGANRESFSIEKNVFFDIDAVIIQEEKTSETDFIWQSSDKSMLIPVNNIGIYLLKASRESE